MEKLGKDERLCPECAETIKLAAKVCKHCGHRLSEAELAAPQLASAEREKRKKEESFDRALKRAALVREISDLQGCELDQWEIEKAAERGEFSAAELLDHAIKRGVIVGQNPRPLDREEWDEALLAGIDQDLDAHAQQGIISRESYLNIGEKHNVYDLDKRIIERGMSFYSWEDKLITPKVRKKEDERRRREEESLQRSIAVMESFEKRGSVTRQPAPDNQYGVLQGTANVIGGCANMWGYVLLIFIIGMIIVGIKSIFE